MQLNTLKAKSKRVTSMRVGRGGKRGKTSGHGGKGQTARAGNKRRPEWRDIIKKLPKRRGYGRNRSRTVVPRIPFSAVSLVTLSKHFKAGDTVSPKALADKGLIRRVSGKFPPVKVLGNEFSLKLTLENVSASASAKTAVEKAGGSFTTR